MTKRPAGGFDCEFVEPPPKVIAADCPICLHVLREPYQATCCGKNFCRGCLEENKTNHSNSCPCCKTRHFLSFEDKRLQQTLYDFRVYCPHRCKGCEWTGELRGLDAHLDSSPPPEKCLEGCPFIVISCPLSYAGCTVKLARKEMREHLEETAVGHMLMQAGRQKVLEADNEKLKKELEDRIEQIVELESDTSYLCSEKEEMEWKIHRFENKLDELETKVTDMIEKYQLALRTGQPIGPTDLTMYNFEQVKLVDGYWCSPPFHTHPMGYKMCLRVDANGWGNGKGTHVSVHVYLMKGAFDEHLKWPFRGEITIQLLGQNRPHSVVVTYAEDTPIPYASRVTENEMSSNGWGSSWFISHDDLYSQHFIMNNCLYFRVSKIVLK